MKRWTLLLAAALVTLAVTAASASAGAETRLFRIVPETSPAGLPSAEVPNAPGAVALPPSLLFRRESQGLPFSTLSALWSQAGAAYGIPWEVLAAINKIESNFGRNMGPSSAGAIGWMQFMPSTWERWGTDATGDGLADPWHAEDAIYSAARYLAAAGGRSDLYRGVYAYNHAHWYVKDVLDLARTYGSGSGIAYSLDRVQVNVEQARSKVAKTNRKLVAAVRRQRSLARQARAAQTRVSQARLLSTRLALDKSSFAADLRQIAAARQVKALRERLSEAEQALSDAQASAFASSFSPGAASLVSAPIYNGDYVFPVGGGSEHVSVGHDHHDYPAADIAAPAGAPLYALAVGVVASAWHMPAGNCGIGFTMRTADGRSWTYCHLSYLEPSVKSGAMLAAGTPVGLVGSTGHSTGPHLHLQLQPATSYPQEEAWFQGFAGRAFTWQDAPTPTLATAPVFTVVEDESAADEVLTFTLRS
jgi:murein DD-endopeptidase MepM/ murein hydrolase activator NlpD